MFPLMIKSQMREIIKKIRRWLLNTHQPTACNGREEASWKDIGLLLMGLCRKVETKDCHESGELCFFATLSG